MIPDSYFDRFRTAKYRSKNPAQRALIRRFVTQVHRFFDASEPLSAVLEVGCGEGFLLGALSDQHVDKRFVGVDLNQDDLDLLRSKFGRIETHQGSAYDLGFLEGPFDLVMCCEVMEHLEDTDRALEQIVSLGPKRVIITVPHEPWFQLSNLARGKNVARLGNDVGHLNHWGRAGLRSLLEPRFEVIELVGSFPWLLALAAPK